jgi:glutathione S-transferase
MLFYDSIGPNPRVVRMFAAERGISLAVKPVDLLAGENRQPGYVAKNPTGTLPALELADGFVLAEITAICEYLDETAPGPSLIGATAQERAETRMWTRRIDLNICEPLTNGYRFGRGLKLFAERIHCIPAAAEDLQQIAQENLAWLDARMQGNRFVCGDRLTLADIVLFAFVDFGIFVRQPINPANTWLAAHHAMMAARPSAKA